VGKEYALNFDYRPAAQVSQQPDNLCSGADSKHANSAFCNEQQRNNNQAESLPIRVSHILRKPKTPEVPRPSAGVLGAKDTRSRSSLNPDDHVSVIMFSLAPAHTHRDRRGTQMMLSSRTIRPHWIPRG
jgi:hypothetical protein